MALPLKLLAMVPDTASNLGPAIGTQPLAGRRPASDESVEVTEAPGPPLLKSAGSPPGPVTQSARLGAGNLCPEEPAAWVVRAGSQSSVGLFSTCTKVICGKAMV